MSASASRRRFTGPVVAATGAVLVIALAGCSGSSGGKAVGTPSSTASASPTTLRPTVVPRGTLAYVRRAPTMTSIVFRRLGTTDKLRRVDLGKGVRAESLRWSPDGTAIVFDADIAGRGLFDVWRLDATANKPVRLTTRAANASSTSGGPVWSPDGRRIAYYSNRNGTFQAWVMDADGRNARQLTTGKLPAAWITWSADGGRILYAQQDGLRSAIFSVPVGGGTPKPLATQFGAQNAPAPSPDGSLIAYSAQVGNDTTPHIWVMRPDGTGKRRLTNGPAGDTMPKWSPDGKRIAFVRNIDLGQGNGIVADVFLMDADGGPATNVTNTEEATEREVSWAPDGSGLVFTSLLGNDDEVVAVGARGGKLLGLSGDPGPSDSWPAWTQQAAAARAVP